jgi:hypothetical protein
VNHSDGAVAGVLEGRIEGIHFRRDVHLRAGNETVVFTADDYAQLRVTNPPLVAPRPRPRRNCIRSISGSSDSQVSDAASCVSASATWRTLTAEEAPRVQGQRRESADQRAGWTDDLLLADTPETIAATTVRPAHDLNCIRCENIWARMRRSIMRRVRHPDDGRLELPVGA